MLGEELGISTRIMCTLTVLLTGLHTNCSKKEANKEENGIHISPTVGKEKGREWLHTAQVSKELNTSSTRREKKRRTLTAGRKRGGATHLLQ